ncbi:MAG: hypothetical protein LBO04_08215 [Spirochaetaceae bacterium]|jgi:transcriptional regulator with XRE-family HTH domain|nr:hypothetical protein [Spirochaetaceae bacterium]
MCLRSAFSRYQANRSPSLEMLERIAAALEIDSPQLFSVNSFTGEAVKRFQDGLLADVGAALVQAVNTWQSEFKKISLAFKIS